MVDFYSKIFQKIQKVLLVVAHPDDMEMIFAGSAARLIQDNKKVRLLVCTDGSANDDRESRDMANIRQMEQSDAIKIIGIPKNELFILPFKDCSLSDKDSELTERIVFHMRSFRPDLIVTHQFETVIEMIEPNFLWISHKDHRAVGTAVMNAIMPIASNKNFYKQHFSQGLKPVEVYKILIPDLVKGKVTIDINSVAEIKRDALRCHKSQMDKKYAEEIMDNHNIYHGVKDKKSYYFEKFRFYEFGYNPNRKDYEEKII